MLFLCFSGTLFSRFAFNNRDIPLAKTLGHAMPKKFGLNPKAEAARAREELVKTTGKKENERKKSDLEWADEKNNKGMLKKQVCLISMYYCMHVQTLENISFRKKCTRRC